MRVFWRRGFRETTTRDLEAAIGIAPSSLYNAFGSKSELLDRALERYVLVVDEALLRPLREGPDGLGSVERFLGDLVDWLLADEGRGCMVGRLMADSPPIEGPAGDVLAAYRARLRRSLRSALERARSAGEIPPRTVDDRVEVLFGMVLGLNLAVRSGLPAEEVAAIARADAAEVAAWRGRPEA